MDSIFDFRLRYVSGNYHGHLKPFGVSKAQIPQFFAFLDNGKHSFQDL